MNTSSTDNLIDRPKGTRAAFDIDQRHRAAVSAPELRQLIQHNLGRDLLRVNELLDQQLQSPHSYMGDVLPHAGEYRGKQIRPILVL